MTELPDKPVQDFETTKRKIVTLRLTRHTDECEHCEFDYPGVYEVEGCARGEQLLAAYNALESEPEPETPSLWSLCWDRPSLFLLMPLATLALVFTAPRQTTNTAPIVAGCTMLLVLFVGTCIWLFNSA